MRRLRHLKPRRSKSWHWSSYPHGNIRLEFRGLNYTNSDHQESWSVTFSTKAQGLDLIPFGGNQCCLSCRHAKFFPSVAANPDCATQRDGHRQFVRHEGHLVEALISQWSWKWPKNGTPPLQLQVNENCLLHLSGTQLMVTGVQLKFVSMDPWCLASHSYADPWDVWRLPLFRNCANVPLLPNGRWLIGMQHQEYHKQLLSLGRCQCVAPATAVDEAGKKDVQNMYWEMITYTHVSMVVSGSPKRW